MCVYCYAIYIARCCYHLLFVPTYVYIYMYNKTQIQTAARNMCTEKETDHVYTSFFFMVALMKKA